MTHNICFVKSHHETAREQVLANHQRTPGQCKKNLETLKPDYHGKPAAMTMPLKIGFPKREFNLPTIDFHGRTISFREGKKK